MEHDSANYYTYSKDHLSSAFPIVNEHTIEKNEKEDNQAVSP